MKARVRADYRWNVVIAFSGIEFVQGEYRDVPAGYEEEAINLSILEIKDETETPIKKVVKK